MTTYATRAAVLDRFLAEYDVDPDDVLSVDFAKYEPTADLRVHVSGRVPGLVYVPHESATGHFTAYVEREDLTLLIAHYQSDYQSEAVPA